jgi:hypothetical protein
MSLIELDRVNVRKEIEERQAEREEGLQFDLDPLAGTDTEEEF